MEYGGAGSGKSIFFARHFINACLQNPRERVLILRKIARTIKESVFNDLKDQIFEFDLGDKVQIYEGTHDFRFFNDSQIITAGLDDVEKLKSISRVTRVHVEEATEISKSDLDQLNIRLRGTPVSYFQLSLAFNPTDRRHFLKKMFVDKKPRDAFVHHTTYLDNPFSNQEAAFEEMDDENTLNVYKLGLWGRPLKGLIYPDWETFRPALRLDEFDCMGLDVGYANPSALIGVKLSETEPDEEGKSKKRAQLQEIIYRPGLNTAKLLEQMDELGVSKVTPIFVDSQRPDVIDDLVSAGYNANLSEKGISEGISTVKAYRLEVEADSENLQDELDSYKWTTKKAPSSGEEAEVDVPVKWNDHGADAFRYAMNTFINYYVGDWVAA